MGDNDQGLIEELLEQVHVYNVNGNHEKANEVLERMLVIQRKELMEDDDSPLAEASILSSIGRNLLLLGDFNNALEKFNKVLAIRLEKQGEKNLETADAYKYIGAVLKRLANNEEAEEMYRKALAIKLAILPSDHMEVTDLYDSVAITLERQGKLSESTKLQKLVLATRLNMHGEDHPTVVQSYIGIASLLSGQDRMDDALKMVDKAIGICVRLQQQLGGEDDDDDDIDLLVLTLQHKARLLEENGNFEASVKLLNEILTMQKEKLGEIHPLTEEAYNDLADAYSRQGIPEEGINALSKILEIRRHLLGDNHPRTKELRFHLEVLKRRKMAQTFNEQGQQVMHAQSDLDEAIQHFQAALDVYNDLYITLPKDAAVVYENISTVKVEQGFLQDGITASAEALKIRRRQQGDDHTETKGRMEAHRSLLKQLLENRI
ncbi:unnamed protein product [Cylindrotheca closterium]|uniref:Kinesin light chain n=1 Tax=Cylindrotheca closterium TaxID=2856 RepID=A0AAD2FQ56_9STRA|nr:unnamed protein product [Cylindrotheca closterium]